MKKYIMIFMGIFVVSYFAFAQGFGSDDAPIAPDRDYQTRINMMELLYRYKNADILSFTNNIDPRGGYNINVRLYDDRLGTRKTDTKIVVRISDLTDLRTIITNEAAIRIAKIDSLISVLQGR